MRNRVERLRIWLLGSVGFLVLVIAAFLGSARYLSHRLRAYLPEKLAANVKIDSTGVSLCDTVGPKTLYCIHAASELEHTDGKFTLHDVKIDLYGKNGDRDGRIYGDEFEYDKNAGVMRATGVVHIDLQAADAASGKVVSSAAPSAKVVHVTTSGLVYLEKLGVAATSQPLEFEAGAMTGHATGADYSTDSGILMLHSAVSMSGMAGKRPVQMTAATAQVDNRNQEIFLTGARCVSLEQTVEAQQATLHTKPDGTLTRVEAQGNVTREAKGSKLVAQHADVVLNAKSQPQSAVLAGGVQYSSDLPLLQRSGQAEQGTIAFDAQGQAKQAVFTGAVHMTERTRATVDAREPWSSRDLTAAKVEVALVPLSGGTSQVRDVEATGNAHLTVGNNGSLTSTRGKGTTELSADDLKVHLVEAKDARQPPRLDTLAGRGHTLLRQVTADGVDQTSSGDTLDATCRVGSASRAGVGSLKCGEGTDYLWSAEQQGHVSMVRRAPAKSGDKANGKAGGQGNAQQDVERASAERAVYDGGLDRVTLTGGVQVSDAGSVLWADQVALDRATGDAHAAGGVKIDYAQDGSVPRSATKAAPAEATHIVADRADLEHGSGVATFYGRPVRLWQGGSQVQAPVVQLARAEKRLTARGDASAAVPTAAQTAQVHTLLVSARDDRSGATNSVAAKPSAPKAAAGKAGPESQMPNVVRIASNGLVYSGDLRRAEFTGGVRAETVDGTIRASEATVYLQQGAKQVSSSAEEELPSLAGNVERMVATGQIDIEQPGRRATGERLVYTADDRLFVLTGDCNLQPRLLDASRGTVTGAALRFHAGDDSVVVSNGAPCASGETEGQRARTGTPVRKDATIGKGKQ